MSRRGFTLLELVVVVTILGILTSAVVPVYVGAMDGLRKRNAQLDFVATLSYVQERAVSDSREYRLYIDPDSNSYWAARVVDYEKDEKIFDAVDEEFGQEQFLPVQLEFEKPLAPRDRKAKAFYIGCYPNGACDRVTLKIRDAGTRRAAASIETLGAIGRFKIEVQER